MLQPRVDVSGFLQRESSAFLLLDGGLGSLLAGRGESMHEKLWAAGHLLEAESDLELDRKTPTDTERERERDIERQQILQRVHRDYLEAGAQILTTASFQLSLEGLRLTYDTDTGTSSNTCSNTDTNPGRGARLDDDALLAVHRRAFAKSVSLARAAVASSVCCSPLVFQSLPLPLVAVSAGCFGAHLCNGAEYSGVYPASYSSIDALFQWHHRQFDNIIAAGADLIGLETIPCLAEAQALLRLLDRTEDSLSVWLSIACRSQSLLNSGESVEDFCRAVEDSDDMWSLCNGNRERLIVGVNCTSPLFVEDIVLTMREHTRRSRILIAYPNRGDVWDGSHKCYVEPTHDVIAQFTDLSVRWYDAGARIIGGCCQTNPVLIHALAETLTRHIASPI